MRVSVLQHVPFEGLGSIAPWLSDRGADVQFTRFYESAALPDPRAVDLVIAMGGPMSVNDEREHPWLKQEKGFIEAAIRRGLPVVGVCLGAQLIASALGARVFANAHKEIGWLPIGAVDSDADTFRFPRRVTVFHWHGETFDLPRQAVHLARSAGCENQAFQVSGSVIGLQFHLETTPELLDALIQKCRSELVDGPYIQPEQVMRAAPESTYAEINTLMADMLAYVTRSPATRARA